MQRQRSIEIIYTNGLTVWSRLVEGSELKKPWKISYVDFSVDRSTLLVKNRYQGMDLEKNLIKIFKWHEKD